MAHQLIGGPADGSYIENVPDDVFTVAVMLGEILGLQQSAVYARDGLNRKFLHFPDYPNGAAVGICCHAFLIVDW